MKNPRYSIFAAVSVDGKIAAPGFEGAHWTSKEDKKFLHEFLDKSDVVIVGATTYELAKEPLAKRNCIVFSRKKSMSKKSSKLITINPEKQDIDAYIRSKGYKKIAILGGSQVYSYFLGHDLVDDIYLTIEPILFGSGTPLVAAELGKKSLTLQSCKLLNKKGTLLLRYRVANTSLQRQ